VRSSVARLWWCQIGNDPVRRQLGSRKRFVLRDEPADVQVAAVACVRRQPGSHVGGSCHAALSQGQQMTLARFSGIMAEARKSRRAHARHELKGPALRHDLNPQDRGTHGYRTLAPDISKYASDVGVRNAVSLFLGTIHLWRASLGKWIPGNVALPISSRGPEPYLYQYVTVSRVDAADSPRVGHFARLYTIGSARRLSQVTAI
jgi:hypothetical protein